MMKNVIKLIVSFSLFLWAGNIHAQSEHGEWGGHFTFRTQGFFPSIGVYSAWNYLMNDLFKVPWLKCRTEGGVGDPFTSSHIIWGNDTISIYTPMWWDAFSVHSAARNYNVSVGYSVGYRWPDIPFKPCVDVGLRYEWQGLSVPYGQMEGRHSTTSIMPTIGFAINLGKAGTTLMLGLMDAIIPGNKKSTYYDGVTLYEDREWRPRYTEGQVDSLYGWGISLDVIGTVSYVKNITYNGPLLMGKDAINSGVRVSIGVLLSVKNEKSHFDNLGFSYEWDCYNYFNLLDVVSRQRRLVWSIGFVL